MHRSSKAFIESLPDGTFYVLSREGHGFALTGDAAQQADELTEANFKRVEERLAEEDAKDAGSDAVRESV